MSSPAVLCETQRPLTAVRWWDFLEMTKPRIAVLVLLTVGVGSMVAAGGMPDPWIVLHAVLGTALVAGSASVLNQYLERHTDTLMLRTANRPLASGRMESRDALAFGSVLLVLGTAYLWCLVNLTTAVWGVVTWLLYVAVYTPLKSKTTLNTFIGAIPGALPAVMGWTATGRPLNMEAGVLFLIVFLWQFPHFMAIAWLYREDYAQAGLKMLPSVDPTGRLAPMTAVLHSLVLLPVSLAPAALAGPMAGSSYFAAAAVLGLAYFGFSLAFCVHTSTATARGLLKVSLVYLPSLLVFLVLDLTPTLIPLVSN